MDFSQVTIENLGQVEFDQAFALLHSAPREALLAWTKRLEALPIGPRRTAGISAFFKTLAQIDAKTAVDLALSMERREARWTAFGSISNATPAVNLKEVARLYTALNEKKLSIFDLVLNWSRSDPVATAAFLSGYRGDVEKDDLRVLMANWAALDPAAAREWLAKADPARRDSEVYAGFYSGWLEHDRFDALSDLTTHIQDPTFKKALEVVSLDLFKESQEAVRTFILTLPPAEQQTAVDSIVHDVTAIYLSGGPDLKVDEVAAWLIGLPETLWHDQLGHVLNRWPDEDVARRNAWLDQLPPGTQDAVFAEFCRAYNSYDPTDNFRAGLRIQDAKLREQTLGNIFRGMETDVRQELLSHVQLSSAEMQELAKILKKI